MYLINKTRSKILILSLVTTFVLIRVVLHFYPDADFNLAGHNIHHLYTGLLLVILGGLPIILFSEKSKILNISTAVFGVGLSLAADEWIYLITTDGSNESYFLPVSLWGGMILVVLICLYIGFLYFLSSNRNQ